jgi:esterase/lipase superfamily enzyme
VVDVAGHSLGARGVVLALYEVASREPDIRLDEVVLLAPDMDFEIFRRMLPRIRPITDRITVYVTSGDRPPAISAQLHGYPRLGEAGNDVETLEGVEVIDLSDLPAASPTGHLYHIHSPSVGEDLDQLLNEGPHAAQRRNLVQFATNTWRLRQPGSEEAD